MRKVLWGAVALALLLAACGPSDEELTAMVQTEVERQVALIPPAPQGEVGPQGPQGIQGEPGKDGERGEVGPQGPQGVQGPIGPRGVEGPQGERGATGSEGPVGRRGEQGPTGATGPQGEPGAGGSGLIMWEAPPTVSSTGNLTTTFRIMNGRGTRDWFVVQMFGEDGTYLGLIDRPWNAPPGAEFVAHQYDLDDGQVTIAVGLGATASVRGLVVCVRASTDRFPDNPSVEDHSHGRVIGCMSAV